MRTFLGLSATHWWALDCVLLALLVWQRWCLSQPRWCPREGWEPTSRCEFLTSDYETPIHDPWLGVLFEENSDGVQKYQT